MKSLTNSVGLSDHSNPDENGNLLSAAALTYEIDYIERHFTVLKKDESKDGPVSVNPSQLADLVNLTKLSKKNCLIILMKKK